ncbi:MAG: general secretion pathway protein E [Parcubacteria bacterium C7867-001]|nr:MAG: general secretion pathway protein E [Parcubacteria bacterium C7867-001]
MQSPSPVPGGVVGSELKASLASELAKGNDISIIRVLETLLERAHLMNASDIHIDPARESVRIRFRVDGVLQDIESFPKSIHQEVISRIKVVSQLRTDEHHTPQDGRFRQALSDGRFIDIRVSIAPTYHGENCVLRILADHSENYSLAMLGFSESDCKKIETAIHKTSGMILSTGPTGSGKTTTLYTLIKMLSAPEVAIVTIEDPIEYSVDSIEQIQVNTRSGLTFATGLRSILRQDPDIIMVGEIRDGETATIAVNAALTGHLLFSTLHTNDATTTLPRLSDMGIDPYLVASTMNIAIGQRLVRKICDMCKEKHTLTDAEFARLSQLSVEKPFAKGETIYRGKGCANCNESGYRGRLSINEVLVATPALRELILTKASAEAIRQTAIKEGMTTMLEDGMEKVRAGDTTIEEVLRVVHE